MPEFYVSSFASNVQTREAFLACQGTPRRLTHCMRRLIPAEGATAEDAAVAALKLTAWSNRLPTKDFPRLSSEDVLLQAWVESSNPFWVLISPRPGHV